MYILTCGKSNKFAEEIEDRLIKMSVAYKKIYTNKKAHLSLQNGDIIAQGPVEIYNHLDILEEELELWRKGCGT